MERQVYLDHAATTPMRPEVLEAMLPYLKEKYGNASSLYGIGREARSAIDEARATVAKLLGAQPDEIIFTSCGTESNNHAIYGAVNANLKKGNHIITSAIEHHAILEPFHFLEKQGFEVTTVPVDKYGIVDPEDIKKAIKPGTILVSVMHGNNEVGTIEPISDISKITKEAGVAFHVDGVQTVGSIPVDVHDLGADAISMSAHKFYGPKGVGALYVRKGTRILPHIRGGAQERNKRAGTENVAGIVGLAKALELATAGFDEDCTRVEALRNKLIAGLFDNLTHIRLNGHPTKRLPNNVNICVRGVEGEAMLLYLDMKGVCASSGSACTSGSLEPSHVLLAMDIPQEVAHGSLRFSLGRKSTEEDVAYALEVLPPIIERLRQMSPYQQPEEYYVRM